MKYLIKTNTPSPNKRINEIIKYYCSSKKDFADKLGKSKQWVSNITVEGFPIGMKTVSSIIEKFPNVSPNWLLFGTGEPLLVQDDNNTQNEAIEINPDYMEVELVSKYAYAGYLSGYGDAEYIETLPKIRVLTDRMVHGNYKCFEIKGDSMFDNSYESWVDGDIILCREVARHLWLPKLHMDKCDFILVHKDGILIKRIIDQNNEDGTITIHSLNPDKSAYPDQVVLMDDIMQIFAVVKLVDRVARR